MKFVPNSSLINAYLGFTWHVYNHGDQTEKELAWFLNKNLLKGAAIGNTIVTLVYFTRFKGYRNSYLLRAQVVATLMGLGFAANGLEPIFIS